MALSAKDRKGVALIVVLVALVAAVLVAKIRLSGVPAPGPDLCVAPVTSRTVVLIDHSDGITEQGAAEIRARVDAFVRDRVPVNGQVSVFTVSSTSERALEPLFAMCKPPEGGNRLYQDQRGIARRFRKGFAAPLEAALRKPIEGADRSPIAEALVDLSLSEYMRADRVDLLVFSDLMQNSRNGSLYGCASGRDAVAEFRRARAGAQERPHFSNVAVRLNVVPREGLAPAETGCRQAFWAWFFGDDEGSNASLETSFLPGGASRER